MSRSLTFQLVLVTMVLSLVGLLFVYEASVAEAFQMVGDPYFFLKQQLIRWVIGWGALVVAAFLPLSLWRQTAVLWYIGAIILLALVFVPGIGLELNGAHRWLTLGGFVLQPIEIMKLGLVCYFSVWLSKHQRLGPFLLLTGIPVLLTIMQPDLGSLLIVSAIAVTMYFVAGGNWRAISLIGVVGLLFVVIAVASSPYRLRRVTTFINPDSDPLGASFHIRQIVIALGNGGWIGQGLGNSRQKFAYIPEASTDSIFAIVAEEVGFAGSLVLLGLWWWWVKIGWSIANRCHEEWERYLAVGITAWIASQTVLNLASVVALVPLTGVPLPFFSYGGSSLVMILLVTGILIRLSRQVKP